MMIMFILSMMMMMMMRSYDADDAYESVKGVW